MKKKRHLLWIVPVCLLFLCVVWYGIRRATMPAPPPPTKAMLEQAKQVKIIRDQWGVPHIFGRTDADAAFGLAYAHAEDDFPMIQLVLAAAIGRLSLLRLSKQAIGNDFYVSLIRGQEQADALYPKLSPKVRALLEAYARGLSFYAAKHPKEADGRLFPTTGKAVAMGFIHKIPLMFNLPRVLGALNEAKSKKVGDKVFLSSDLPKPAPSRLRLAQSSFRITGSNTHAVSRHRSADDVTRLNVNSHQPWAGPVTWYEAHVVSQEGWNMLGGTFPGAPFLLHGHNQHLGWAHTNNYPDLVDVYKLVMHPKQPLQYRLDGKWQKLEERTAKIAIDTGLFTYPLKMKVYWSKHGPVFKAPHGFYAIRYAGIGKAIFASEQWFQMNKAKNFEAWKAAMRIHAIPMFNTGFADRDNIFYVYNALLPMRKPGVDYTKILPGDRSDLIWNTYLPWDKLPQVHNPPSGFVQNCNATPFKTTSGAGNPLPKDFSPLFGIETFRNNRTDRSLKLLSVPGKLTKDAFLKMKFDQTYGKSAPLLQKVLRPVLQGYTPQTDDEKAGINLLKKWDHTTHPQNIGAALALLTRLPLTEKLRGGRTPEPKDAIAAFQNAVKFLRKHYGKLDIPLGTLQRLRRGKLDLPLGGGPDVISAVHSRLVKDKLVGFQGDSYILLAEFTKDGVRSFSRHQYGNVNRPNSPHYADQAPDFLKLTLKPVALTQAALRKQKFREYHPGQ